MSPPRSCAGAAALLLALSLACASAADVLPGRWRDFSATAGVSTWDPPSWCRGKDCPRFELVKTLPGGQVEKRRYQGAHWAITNATEDALEDALSTGNKKLDSYWKGGNEGSHKLSTTVPTLVIFYPSGNEGKREIRHDVFTVEQYLPFEIQDSPPLSKTDGVTVIPIPEQEVYVDFFTGFAKEDEIVDRVFDLVAQLKQQGINDVNEEFFGYAQYDEPLRLVGRHNEIWVFSTTAPSAVAAESGTVAQAWEAMRQRVVQIARRAAASIQKSEN